MTSCHNSTNKPPRPSHCLFWLIQVKPVGRPSSPWAWITSLLSKAVKADLHHQPLAPQMTSKVFGRIILICFYCKLCKKCQRLNKYRINDFIELNEWKYTHEENIEWFKSKWVYLKSHFFQWLFVWPSVNYSTLLVTAVPQWNAFSCSHGAELAAVCTLRGTWELLTISSVIKSLHFYLPWVAEWFSK